MRSKIKNLIASGDVTLTKAACEHMDSETYNRMFASRELQCPNEGNCENVKDIGCEFRSWHAQNGDGLQTGIGA